jgi:hypothetical protein
MMVLPQCQIAAAVQRDSRTEKGRLSNTDDDKLQSVKDRKPTAAINPNSTIKNLCAHERNAPLICIKPKVKE